LQNRISWKEKRETSLHYDVEADAYDELYSDEQKKKNDTTFSQLVFSLEERIGELDLIANWLALSHILTGTKELLV